MKLVVLTQEDPSRAVFKFYYYPHGREDWTRGEYTGTIGIYPYTAIDAPEELEWDEAPDLGWEEAEETIIGEAYKAFNKEARA